MIKNHLIFCFFAFECLSFENEKLDNFSNIGRSYFGEILEDNFFDPSIQFGLNLKAIVRDQHNRRMEGVGAGFSIDIYGLSVVGSKLNGAYGKLILLLQEEIFLNRESKCSKSRKKRLKSISTEIKNKKSEIALLRQTQEFFVEKLTKSGLTQEQLSFLPTVENFPKISEK